MLLALAALFAVINGANDGGAMVASTLRVPGQRAVASIAALSAALVVVPAVLGTGVASTLTSGLVRAPDDAQAELIATGVIAAVVVVAVLTRWGLPTSLTLGVVGGIVGAGLGRGLPLVPAGILRVALIGMAAPVVGGAVSQVLAKASSAVLTAAGGQGLAAFGWLATGMQAIAYAANDGQKMLVVLGVTAAGVALPSLLGVAVLFAAGTVVGTASASGTLGRSIAGGTPHEEVVAQFGGSAAVLSSAALGVPVSMTQAVSGGLVGTGLLRGLRQIRWRVAGQLAIAWLLTLPAALVVGLAAAGVWGMVG